ncbi:MAG: hypothetical protein IJO03_09175 [Clostridia bacterium]|nr:hypothetical protein [Clostridia bacterium]
MTNKEKYISSFSGVEPSDEIKERILNMASTKKRCSFKALAVVFATLMLIATAMLTANAATDGALGEKIGEVSKEITEKIRVMLNGEEVDVTVKKKVLTNENGDSNIFEVIVPDDFPASEDGKYVLELDKMMQDIGKMVIGKEDGNSTGYEVSIETESENYKVVSESYYKVVAESD